MGYVVLEPLNKDGIYDFVIEKDGIFRRIQVKTLRDLGSVYELNLRSTGKSRTSIKIKSYSKVDVDVFVGVDIATNRVFEVPFLFDNRATMILRKISPENNQKSKVRYASDFEI